MLKSLNEHHVKFACVYCGQEGEVIWGHDAQVRNLIRLSNGFHVEERRLPGARHVIICDVCDEIDPISMLNVPPLGSDEPSPTMSEREYLVKAQEAEVLANAAEHLVAQLTWFNIATEYRRLASEVAAMREKGTSSKNLEE